MIRTMLCNEDYCSRRQLDRGDIGPVLSADHNMLWLDLESPTADEMAFLAGEFGFHPLALEDATKQHQRPKVDRYDTFHFLVFYGVGYEDESNYIAQHEVDIFIGKNYLITIHNGEIDAIKEVASRLGNNLALIEHGVGVLLYSLLDAVVDHYIPIADRIGARIEMLERRIFTVRSQREREGLQEDIFALRRTLLNLRRVLGPQIDLLSTLARRDIPAVGPKTAVYFQDVHDHLLRVAEVVDVHRELLGGAFDSYHAMNASNLNEVMKVLAACSIILMSVALIAGIYGMNFNPAASPFNMPELAMPFGYPASLALMAVVGAVLTGFFKHKGWL